MLKTLLTERWGLRYPIVGAPMAGIAFGPLARAVTEAGGLGCIGIGAQDPVTRIADESQIASDGGKLRFGIGLMEWAVRLRPELFDATLEAKPFLIALSFGDVAPYVERVHAAGAILATQVQSRDAAIAAERAGADIIVAQGTEAGGHTGEVATLTLLQVVLEAVKLPVIAAGGIASGRGLAAALAAGACGAWIGTPLLASPEAHNSQAARDRVVAARENETVLTRLFDRVQNIPWPTQFPGRALQNDFTKKWHGHEDAAANDPEAMTTFRRAKDKGDYAVSFIYAGQGVGLVDRERAAGDVVRDIGDGAEALLRKRFRELFV
ncbi:MAG: nitronate monooxygenase [Candidatus Eremiobacteraeota bacterium]|nr:nitronate monooxygenase [Candidatus Eremiobacteraeota bacterium]